MTEAKKSSRTSRAKPAKPKSHARFLRYASLRSVNTAAASITPEEAAEAVRLYLEAEAAA